MVGSLFAAITALAWIALLCNINDRARQRLHRCLPILALAGWFLLLLLLFLYVAIAVAVSF
ncbi:hypothetical protein MyNCGM683_06650 [Achromobacter xylosoxidans]